MECEAELIEFKKPLETTKTLYITGISGRLTELECRKHLQDALEMHGLIYDILVYRPKQDESASSDVPARSYAFVKFYSTKAAAMAKSAVHLKYMLDGQLLKAQYPKGNNIDAARKGLFIEKCHQLANYYLGFNGWTSHIISLSEYTEGDEKDVASFVCNARITFCFQDISSDGIGLGQAAFNPTEIESKMVAIIKAKKTACNRAYENAFSKAKIVVLRNGKVALFVDDSTSPITSQDLKGVIKVNKIDVEPEEEPIDEIDWESSTLLQDINEQLLVDLELEC